jgi:hypothetical protein
MPRHQPVWKGHEPYPVNATPSPETLKTPYTLQKLAGLSIVAATFLVIAVLRRFAAARVLGNSIRQSVVFACRPHTPLRYQPQIRGLLVGEDNRTSTSKVTAALWTIVLAYIVITLALVCGLNRDLYKQMIGTISLLYVVLLGGPFAAGVLAKSIVSTSTSTGQLQKGEAAKPRIADVYSDDEGNTDFVDTQYLLFNLIVAVIVLAQFISSPGSGAPPIPDFLAALTGTAAATYVANKALVSGNPPVIDHLAPGTARVGACVTAFGTDLVVPGVQEPKVFVNGGEAEVLKPLDPTAVVFRVPEGTQERQVDVIVQSSPGVDTKPQPLTVVTDSISVTGLDDLYKTPGQILVLSGSGFFSAADLGANGRPMKGARPAHVYLTAQKPKQSVDPASVECSLDSTQSSADSRLYVVVPGNIFDVGEAGWFSVSAARGALTCDPNKAIRVTRS